MAAFHVSVGSFFSVLAALGCAILVTFQALGSSLVIPGWFSGLWKAEANHSSPLGLFLSTFPGIMHLLLSMGMFCCPMLSSKSHLFNYLPTKGIVMSVELARLHLLSKTAMFPQWQMRNASVDYGLFPRTSMANAPESLYCLLLMTWAFCFELSSFHHSQKGTVLAKLFWVFRSLAFVSREIHFVSIWEWLWWSLADEHWDGPLPNRSPF